MVLGEGEEAIKRPTIEGIDLDPKNPAINWNQWRQQPDGTYERVFARYEHLPLDATQLLMLSQIRQARNPAFDSLWDSVEANDMINQPSVSRLSPEQLESYIAATNHIWESDRELEDFAQYLTDDGHYYLVSAGHTRVRTVLASIEEVTKVTGKPARALIECSINRASTPLEIIGIQASENNYSAPSPERRAIAIVEAFYYGLHTGAYASPEDFIAQSNGLVDAAVLRDAFAFMQLPQVTRRHIFDKNLYYDSGVRIGRAAEFLKKYAQYDAGYAESVALSDELKEVYAENYQAIVEGMVQYIKIKRMSVRRANQYIDNELRAYSTQLTAWRRERDGLIDDSDLELDLLGDLGLSDPAAIARSTLAARARRLQEGARTIAQEPARRAAEYLTAGGLRPEVLAIAADDARYANDILAGLQSGEAAARAQVAAIYGQQ